MAAEEKGVRRIGHGGRCASTSVYSIHLGVNGLARVPVG
jgi:hypothetical protein